MHSGCAINIQWQHISPRKRPLLHLQKNEKGKSSVNNDPEKISENGCQVVFGKLVIFQKIKL